MSSINDSLQTILIHLPIEKEPGVESYEFKLVPNKNNYLFSLYNSIELKAYKLYIGENVAYSFHVNMWNPKQWTGCQTFDYTELFEIVPVTELPGGRMIALVSSTINSDRPLKFKIYSVVNSSESINTVINSNDGEIYNTGSDAPQTSPDQILQRQSSSFVLTHFEKIRCDASIVKMGSSSQACPGYFDLNVTIIPLSTKYEDVSNRLIG